MQIRLTFLGAARNVTGSRNLLEANGTTLLVDCGLYQERSLRARNWEPFHVPPASLSAVLLTHAHIDHSGYLPRLVREGFRGPVYCTGATAEIARISLLDAAHLLKEDAEFKKRRHQREGRTGPHPEIPLYDASDAAAVSPLFQPVKYKEPVELGPGIEAVFFEAGHVLGSAMVQVNIRRNGQLRRVLFSGDIGSPGRPIIHDPTYFEESEYVVMESTYGDRVVNGASGIARQLEDVINSTVQAGGNIVIPSFALERSQELLYYLNKLLMKDRIPHLMVFLDSPMAVNITDVFGRHHDLYDSDMRTLVRNNNSPFEFPGLKLVRTSDESKAINHIKGNVIIIAGSGMCTGGRIKHHLVSNISRPESTVLFVGYQAEGTLGRQIVDGAKEVRILGQCYPVRAKVVRIDGFSAHADRNGLLRWILALRKPPRRIFVTHGEEQASTSFAALVHEKSGWPVSVPAYLDQVLLD